VDLKQIKELMAAMEKTATQRLRIKEEGFELLLERQDGRIQQVEAPSQAYYKPDVRDDRFFHGQEATLFKAGASLPQSKPTEESAMKEESKAKKGDVIKSPMVGTFYMAPSPDDQPFVKIGDTVEPDSVICIIEAMKVMNEIKAGVRGRISEILVDNSQPVEFGTPLYRIES
jgi:acetyl-CoA carboxylase biotin carboxyl carrier protein